MIRLVLWGVKGKLHITRVRLRLSRVRQDVVLRLLRRLVVSAVVLNRVVGIGADRCQFLMAFPLHFSVAWLLVLFLILAGTATFDASVAVLVNFQENLEEFHNLRVQLAVGWIVVLKHGLIMLNLGFVMVVNVVLPQDKSWSATNCYRFA